jgi:hypothetical protein
MRFGKELTSYPTCAKVSLLVQLIDAQSSAFDAKGRAHPTRASSAIDVYVQSRKNS